MSTSSGKLWLNPLRVTVTFVTFPSMPLTAMLDGYGIDAVGGATVSAIVIGVEFVNVAGAHGTSPPYCSFVATGGASASAARSNMTPDIATTVPAKTRTKARRKLDILRNILKLLLTADRPDPLDS
jgi:hypothetical protein